MSKLRRKLRQYLKYLIERYPPIGKFLSTRMNDVEVISLQILNWIDKHVVKNFKIRVMKIFKGIWGSRVVPLNYNIDAETKFLPRQEIFELISRSEVFAIGECYCRKKHQKETGCTHPRNTCILINAPQGKSLYDIGEREILFKNVSKDYIIALLDYCDKKGLVHQLIHFPSPNYFYVICNCCICCCEILSNYKKFLTPAVVKSDFIEITDTEICINCGKCVINCPFEARKFNNSRLIVDELKCFGCGLCIRKCPQNAIKLTKR
ncbi:MAG: ATP-binding protein [Promethearchaeota archaeon]